MVLVSVTGAELAAHLEANRFHYADEEQLQEAIETALARGGYSYQREVKLDIHGRIDFLVERVGIEVKVAGSTAEVLRQLRRYTRSEAIDEILLITTRLRHTQLSDAELAKPLTVVALSIAGL